MRPGTIEESYGGSAAVIPSTNLVAGWFWWKDRLVAGVVDLEKMNVIRKFEKADTNMMFPYSVSSSMSIAPDGSEAAFEFVGRNEHLFAVWNLKSGKLVYGHDVRNFYRPKDSSEYRIDRPRSGRIRLASRIRICCSDSSFWHHRASEELRQQSLRSPGTHRPLS